MPEPDELPRDWWTSTDVARYLGIQPNTVRNYLAKGLLPPPDRRMGQRANLWKPRTIIKWNDSRPRKGTGSTAT